MGKRSEESRSTSRPVKTRVMDRRAVGRRLSDAIASVAGATTSGSGYHLILSREAMACQFQVFLRPRDREFVPIVHEALDEIDRLERQMTIYRDDSELSLLNRTAFPGPVPVEPGLFALLRDARELGRRTRGAFDITAGPLVRCWGFVARKGRIPSDRELDDARELTGWHHLSFDDGQHSIAFDRPGVEINLGGIGKGYAVDHAASSLRRSGLRHFMIHAGHSSIFAAGDSESSMGWPVSLRHPLQTGESLGWIRLRDQAMSTSGMGQQFFSVDGKRYGHILDPRTGRPGDRAAACTVVAPLAFTAEALSTAFFLMSPREIRDYCEVHPDVGTIRVGLEEPGGSCETLALGISLIRSEVRL